MTIYRTPLLSLVLLQLATGAALAQAADTPLPGNTIDCRDWTRNPDGSWTSHADAKPFDVGNTTGASLQRTTITEHAISMGGFDLWTVVNQKCGGKQR